jgi:hypothetical protein
MMEISDALAKLRDQKITPEQTTAIDQALSLASAEEISDSDLINVLDYINVELLHNRVQSDIEKSLINLHAALVARK